MRLWQTLLAAPWSREEAGVVNGCDRLRSLIPALGVSRVLHAPRALANSCTLAQ